MRERGIKVIKDFLLEELAGIVHRYGRLGDGEIEILGGGGKQALSW